jgi:hypothetical protein
METMAEIRTIGVHDDAKMIHCCIVVEWIQEESLCPSSCGASVTYLVMSPPTPTQKRGSNTVPVTLTDLEEPEQQQEGDAEVDYSATLLFLRQSTRVLIRN